MNTVRVSTLEAFRRWLHDDEAEGDFSPTAESEAMRVGTAFHTALEQLQSGFVSEIQADGYTFRFECDAAIEFTPIREIRGFKRYGDLIVTGQCDQLIGKRIEDHKTTAYLNLERFIEGYQWRYYLDIFNADVFRWNVFTICEVTETAYIVTDFTTLEQRRYAGMAADCLTLASQYTDWQNRKAA